MCSHISQTRTRCCYKLSGVLLQMKYTSFCTDHICLLTTAFLRIWWFEVLGLFEKVDLKRKWCSQESDFVDGLKNYFWGNKILRIIQVELLFEMKNVKYLCFANVKLGGTVPPPRPIKKFAKFSLCPLL